MLPRRIEGVAFRKDNDGTVTIMVAFKDGTQEGVKLTAEEWKNAVEFVRHPYEHPRER